jgi:AAA family ATP:ADP antiporter
VEVIGGRFGKAGGAWIQVLLMMCLSSSDLVALAPYTFSIFIGICALWMFSVKALSQRVEAIAEKSEK